MSLTRSLNHQFKTTMRDKRIEIENETPKQQTAAKGNSQHLRIILYCLLSPPLLDPNSRRRRTTNRQKTEIIIIIQQRRHETCATTFANQLEMYQSQFRTQQELYNFINDLPDHLTVTVGKSNIRVWSHCLSTQISHCTTQCLLCWPYHPHAWTCLYQWRYLLVRPIGCSYRPVHSRQCHPQSLWASHQYTWTISTRLGLS
jgi:hypothetical protein